MADRASRSLIARPTASRAKAAATGLGSRELLAALRRLVRGELDLGLPDGHTGVDGQICAALDAVAAQLGAVSAEQTRVAGEVGVAGKLGVQARVRGARGAWKELLAGVNVLAGSLTNQVRELAQVTTAVARGDLSLRVESEVHGELLAVKTTTNAMIERTGVLTDEINRIGRELGTDGVLGGQIEVHGISGVWKDIVDSLNLLAGNVTQQVRAVARVVTAVASGDLDQTLHMEARGEIATLRDNVNHMIRTLAETTRRNQEQDWLKTNLTRFTRMMQGQRDLPGLARRLLAELAPCIGAQQGTFYMAHGTGDDTVLRRLAAYAAPRAGELHDIALGEGLVGQAALERRSILVSDVPAEYSHIESSLGHAAPRSVVIVPALFEGEVRGVIELASFRPFSAVQLAFLEQLLDSLGIVLASIGAQMRTDELLGRSQRLAGELQAQQEALRQTNDELAEQAEQLALASHYKSQFLANMSHELRTPLNSLLILSRQLADNRRGGLDEQEMLYAKTIHQSGSDLLELINGILDLAKIESGTMQPEIDEVGFVALRDHLERTFRHVAEEKRLSFAITLDPALPRTIVADDMRLKQVLRNLLANAFKFTTKGGVKLVVHPVQDVPGLALDAAAGPDEGFIGFMVQDSGIGIAADQQRRIFEAFQQADGTATRKYGGTGLGLAISRELATLLGGDVRVDSRPGLGSTFTLYLPVVCRSNNAVRSRPPEPPPEPVAEPPRAIRPPEVDADANPEPAPQDHADAALAGRKVLVVDDDIRNIFALTGVLERRDVQVVYAENGREALERLAEHDDIDLVLMDIMMPEMDGHEATRRMRALAPDLPIVALTAQAMPGDRERCLAAGVSDYMTKPVDAEVLLARLHGWLAGPGALSS